MKINLILSNPGEVVLKLYRALKRNYFICNINKIMTVNIDIITIKVEESLDDFEIFCEGDGINGEGGKGGEGKTFPTNIFSFSE